MSIVLCMHLFHTGLPVVSEISCTPVINRYLSLDTHGAYVGIEPSALAARVSSI
jgi:hypothetical protein